MKRLLLSAMALGAALIATPLCASAESTISPELAQPGAICGRIDVDPLKADIPMWGFSTDLRLQADCATALRQVLAAVRKRADDAFRAAGAKVVLITPQSARSATEVVTTSVQPDGSFCFLHLQPDLHEISAFGDEQPGEYDAHITPISGTTQYIVVTRRRE